MIKFTEADRVTEENPIPYEVPILIKSNYGSIKLVQAINNRGIVYYPQNTLTRVEPNNITHFKRMEE